MANTSGLYEQDGSMRVTIANNFDIPSVTTSGSFTRPNNTTAYASGQLVANSTTAGSVVPITVPVSKVGGDFQIRRVKLKKSGTVLTNASFRVHIYGLAAITCANGDGGAWSTTESTYLGWSDVTIDKAFTDGAAGLGAPATGVEILKRLATTESNVYVLIEARGAYTPIANEIFTVSFEVYGS